MPAATVPSPSLPGHPVRHAARRGRAAVVAGIIGAILTAALAGCAPTIAEPVPTSTPTPTLVASPSATPTPTGPALVADGTAADNLPLFDQVVQTVAASADKASGRAYIDALVAAGFDKTAMEVTPDRTTVDDPVDSIQFAVAWDGECLVGQVGPSTPRPTAVVLPALPAGDCLVGKTRPIDW